MPSNSTAGNLVAREKDYRFVDYVEASVLMCTYDRSEFLEDALGRIISQVLPADCRFEVIVVDNGSHDDTSGVVRAVADRSDIPIRYVFEPTAGICHARNRALREARGHLLAFIDDDELADPMWLAELWNATARSGARVVGGAVLLDLTEEQLQDLGREYRRTLREREVERYGDRLAPCPPDAVLGTGNLMIDRTVIETVGGFDEAMEMGGEDADLLIRARKAGFEAWFAPAAIVYHRVMPDRRTVAHLKLDSYRSGAMLAMLRKKHSGWAQALFEMIARIGQAALITVPRLGLAYFSRDEAGLIDRRIKWWRMIGYMRWLLVLAAPTTAWNRTYVNQINYRKRT